MTFICNEQYWIDQLTKDLDEMKKRHREEQKVIKDQIKKLKRDL